jgi:RNA polymerase sigma-70 factor (TIGR02957 family)
MTAADPFVRHRNLLFTVAYEMLGSAADAEDVVQETFLRWADVDKDEVREPRAYLVRIVTRQALNRLRTVSRRREEYVGEWLPEPLLTSPDVADDIELAENISVAMLTVMETLGPIERAVFVLREVFGSPYEEIASALDKSPVAIRQIAHRSREHVAARRPRAQVDRAQQEHAVQRFMAAIVTGDVQSLMDVLAPEIVLISDGGGVVTAARRPIVGITRVMAQLKRVVGFPRVSVAPTWLNGTPALRLQVDDVVSAVSLQIDDGRITHIYAVSNPHKLAWLDKITTLQR